MKGFLVESACNGLRPKCAGPVRLYSRPRLVKALMGRRFALRFLVAPTGFGKTSLALEYAESIFAFQGVHWVNCQSPCFLRDLDAGAIGAGLAGMAQGRALAVFEDVPELDDGRADAFAGCLDGLLSQGWEVLVTAVPGADVFARRCRGRLRIDARDLLVDDAEFVAGRDDRAQDGAPGEGLGAPRSSGMPAVDRVPAFLWGGEQGMRAFIAGLGSAETPAAVRPFVLAMLALREGGLDEAAALSGVMPAGMRTFLERNYPYVGIDAVNETFRAHFLEVEDVMRAFGGMLEAVSKASPARGRDAYAARLSGLLAEKGDYGRACSFMAAACGRRRRLAWLERWQDRLFDAGAIASAQRVFESLGARFSGLTPAALLGSAARLLALGERGPALADAFRALGHPRATPAHRLLSAAVCEACSPSECGERARAVAVEAIANPEAVSDAALSAVAAALAASGDGPHARASAFDRPESADGLASSAWGLLYASLLLEAAARDWPASAADALSSFASDVLARRDRLGLSPSLPEALVRDALIALGALAPADAAPGGGTDGPSRERMLAALSLSLSGQRRQRLLERRAADEGALACAGPNRDAPGASTGATRSMPGIVEFVPALHLRLFGSMEASIGGRAVDPRLLSRRRSKTLLAVLALRCGREIPRQELLDILWPMSDRGRAVNNYYSLWSSLRRALSDGRGECPYLVRRRESCMLDARYVTTDVMEFEALCRTLLTGRPDLDAAVAAFERLQEGFSVDLLPAEGDSAYVSAARERFRRHASDAYAAAGRRFVDGGEPQVALWFARAALEACPGREDASYSLMRAQMAMGQRAQAIDTFFECRAYLASELGIDPSPQMARLYEELIGEPVLGGVLPAAR